MDNINMKNNKYITVLDFEVERIFQYKLENGDGEYGYGDDYARYLTDKGHNIGNIQWMVHDIKEFVDHTIRSVIKKDK